jgi:hypothetical protein
VPAALSPELQAFAATGVVVVVGTRSADGAPAISRGWGVRVVPGGQALEVCVFAATNRPTLENVTDNRQIAVTLTSPSTYRAVQVKGRAVDVSDGSRADADRVDLHLDLFLRELATVGLSIPQMRRVLEDERDVSPELVKIRLEIDEIFDQTPGPSAGARL